MRRIKMVLIFAVCIFAALMLSSCGCEHQAVVDEAVAATCTEYGLTEGSHCILCGDVLIQQQETELKAHKEKTIKAVKATCEADGLTEGKSCSVCGTVLVEQETVPATGHTSMTVPASEATCTTPAYSEGTKCSVCNKMLNGHEETAPAKGHVEEKVSGYAATCDKDGKTDGTRCSVCSTTIKAQTTIKKLGHNEEQYGYCSTCNNYTVTFKQACSEFLNCLFDYNTVAMDYYLALFDIIVDNFYTEMGEYKVIILTSHYPQELTNIFVGEAEEIYIVIQNHPDKNKRVVEYAEKLYSAWEDLHNVAVKKAHSYNYVVDYQMDISTALGVEYDARDEFEAVCHKTMN